MDTLRFTFLEVLSLIGVAQCVYILVHVSFQSVHFLRIVIPLLYFFVLGCAFFSDLARGYLYELSPYYDVISWGLWSIGTPLSALLIIQMAQITKLPPFSNWLILLVVPFALFISLILVQYMGQGCKKNILCDDFYALLNIMGVVAGAASLLMIWSYRTIFSDILSQKAGKERYWLIITLIILNVGLLGVIALDPFSGNIIMVRTVLGLAFMYLVSTSLFRIYPNALSVSYKRQMSDAVVSEDKDIAERIKKLLDLDKVYHEPTYSRSDLAKELGISEAAVSRIISVYFKTSLPQLLNERRVEDSKVLLLDTKENMKIIAQEVGFNSLPSFNRAFKDFVGQSPSSYRKNIIK